MRQNHRDKQQPEGQVHERSEATNQSWRGTHRDGDSEGKMCVSVNPKEWVKIRGTKNRKKKSARRWGWPSPFLIFLSF